jgi:hypothetical protein
MNCVDRHRHRVRFENRPPTFKAAGRFTKRPYIEIDDRIGKGRVRFENRPPTFKAAGRFTKCLYIEINDRVGLSNSLRQRPSFGRHAESLTSDSGTDYTEYGVNPYNPYP